MTAPQLFAGYRPIGDRRCFFCDGQCDETHRSADHVKSSFTSRDTVAGGEYVCAGCVAAMNESADIEMLDGIRRTGQMVRGYSWIVTDVARAATKAHRELMRELCLSPPTPPFVICISDSGQKHLLYRAVVCHSREVVTVTLEGDKITYRPHDLRNRIDLAERIIACVGKIAAAEPLTPRDGMKIVTHDEQGELILTAWLECREQSLSRLAVWLSAPKEKCIELYPPIAAPVASAEHGAIQTAFSWTD